MVAAVKPSCCSVPVLIGDRRRRRLRTGNGRLNRVFWVGRSNGSSHRLGGFSRVAVLDKLSRLDFRSAPWAVIDQQQCRQANSGNRRDDQGRTDCWLALGHVVPSDIKQIQKAEVPGLAQPSSSFRSQCSEPVAQTRPLRRRVRRRTPSAFSRRTFRRNPRSSFPPGKGAADVGHREGAAVSGHHDLHIIWESHVPAQLAEQPEFAE
jgi:hypothetical protein